MRKQFSVTAKRLLSFALALVLLLSLCPALPLTADAANYQENWQPSSSYSWITEVYFASENATNVDGIPVFEDDEPYDWAITVYQSRTTVNITAKVTITDEKGNIVGGSEVTGSSKESTKGQTSVMFSASEYSSALSTDLAGTFKLTCKLYYGTTLCGTLTQTFKRTISDDSGDEDYYTFTDGWTFASSKMGGQFKTKHQDLVFTDDEPYDWEVYLGQSMGNTYTISVSATVRDSGGNVVGTPVTLPKTSTSGNYDLIFSASEYPDLPTNKSETYTLTLTASSGGQTYATLIKSFTRKLTADDVTFTATSRSKPGMVFTYADPIDLELNIKKNDAVAEAFNAATTITNASGETVSSDTYPIPSSTNTTVSVKDLVPVTDIQAPGNYTVNVALQDGNGNTKYETTIPFAVVAMNRTVSIRIDGEDTYEDVVPTLTVYAQKDDGVTENCTAVVTVIDIDTGNPVYSNTITGAVSGNSANPTTLYPNLDNLPIVGNFRMDVVVMDSEGVTLGNYSKPFTRTSSQGLEVTLTDNTGISKYGNIFNQDEKPLVLNITHPNGVGEILKVKFTGTYNGATLNETYNVQIPEQGFISVEPKYGIYENLAITVYDASGNEVYPNSDNPSTYTFTYVRSEADPGELLLLNVNDHFTSGHGDDTTRLNLTAQTGAAMWRATMPWSTVEPTEGNYISMTSIINNVIQPTLDLGLEPIVILAYNNEIYGDADPTSSTWLNAYANYCAEVARQLTGKVRYYEIWNEWNASMGKVPEAYRTGDYYAKVLVAASEAIKAVDPNAKIIGGAVAGDTGQEDWIRAMLSYDANSDGQSDAIAAMDGFSFHSYAVSKTNQWSWDKNYDFDTPAEHGYTTRFQFINGLLTEYGADDSMEVWMTETGWATNAKGLTNDKYYTGVSEQQQAAYLVQLYTWALAHPNQVDRIFWYDLMNDGTDNTQIEQNWGLVNNYSVGYTAKQSYVATCAMSSMLAGATNGTSVNLGSGIYAYRFEKDDHYLMAVWTDGTAKSLTATLNGSMVVTDMFGNATSYLNSAPLSLSEVPIYLEYGLHANPTIG